MAEDQVVAVGFLTRRDLDILGTGFHRQFPIENDDVFADLLKRLDHIEAVPLGRNVTLRIRAEGE